MIPEWMDLTVNKYLSREKKTSEEELRRFLKSKDKRKDILRGGVYEELYRKQLDKIAGRKTESSNRASFKMNLGGYYFSNIAFDIIEDNSWAPTVTATVYNNNQIAYTSSYVPLHDNSYRYDEFQNDRISQYFDDAYHITTQSSTKGTKYFFSTDSSEKMCVRISKESEPARAKFGERYIRDGKLGLKSIGIGLYCSKHPTETLEYPWSICPRCAAEHSSMGKASLSEISEDAKRTICRKIDTPHYDNNGIFDCRIDGAIPWDTDSYKEKKEKPIEVNFLVDDEVVTKIIRPQLISKQSLLYDRVVTVGHRSKFFYDHKTEVLSKVNMFPWKIDDDDSDETTDTPNEDSRVSELTEFIDTIVSAV